MTDAPIYYRPSGRFAPLALLTTIVVGTVVAAAGGFAYGIIVFYMPIIYVNALLCVGLGFGIAAVVRWMAMKHEIRSLAAVAVAGLIAGLVAEYAAFVGWLLPVADWNVIIYEPVELVEVLQFVASKGVWGFSKGDPVTGVLLYLFWLVEGVTIVGLATNMSLAALRTTPYCETCGQWLTDAAHIGPFEPIADVPKMRANLERGDFSALGDVKPLGPDSPKTHFAQFELRDCPTCDAMAVMTMRNITVTIDKEGKANTSSEPVIENLLIDRESSSLIKQVLPNPDQPPPQATAIAEPPAETDPAENA